MQGVPQLTVEEHNQARRFVTLVDELYEHKVRLVCSAEVPAAELFSAKFDAARLSAPDFEGFGTDRRGGPAAGPNAYSRSYEPGKVRMASLQVVTFRCRCRPADYHRWDLRSAAPSRLIHLNWPP